MQIKNKKLIIFLNKNLYEKKYQNDHVFWNSNLKENNSLAKIIEKNKKILRNYYLDFIFELGEKKINGKSLKSISQLSNGHNMWEMSTINEKNIFKSKNIKDCIKLICLQLLVKKNKINHIIFVGNDNNINLSIKSLCLLNKISYLNEIIIEKKKINFPLNKKIFPYFLRSLFFLIKYIFSKINIISLKKNYSYFNQNKITIFSYFVHLKKSNNKDRINLWGGIDKILNKRNKKINMINDFSPSNDVPNSSIFLNKIKLMSNKHNSYIPLDMYFSLIDIFKVKINYLFVCLNFFLLKNREKYFYYNKIKINFYHFLKDDFKSSFYGETLVKNLIYICIFENLFSKISKQNNAFYLYENQGWEKALVTSWKKYNHGNLVGSINSTIRFWDLRYFQSKKLFNSYLNFPNFILVNGHLSKKIANKANILKKKNRIIEVEALRYQYMLELRKNKNKKNRNVIIFGDILVEENFEICKVLSEIKDSLKKNYIFYFKPHPTLHNKYINIIKKKYSFLKLLDNNVNYSNFNYAICCGTTSAIIESLYFNIQTIVFAGSSNLNLCPFPKENFNNYAFSKNDIENFLEKNFKYNCKVESLLNLNFKYRKWNKLFDKLKI